MRKFRLATHRLPALLGAIGLAGLLVCAGLVRFRMPPLAIAEWDSWGWLGPALSWIGGTGFKEEFEREWLYGAFIAGCLRLTGSFSGYIIIQQGLGLVAAVMMWSTWRAWLSLSPLGPWVKSWAALAVLPLIAAYLFSPVMLAFELSIRPEAIMPFVVFAQLLCATAYCRYRWIEPSAAGAASTGAAAIFLACALYILKPNWLLAVPLTTLPVWIGVFGRRLPQVARLTGPVLGVVLVGALLILPEKIFFVHTAKTRVVLPMTLFTIHADIIREVMARELPSAPPDRRRFLEDFLPVLDAEMVEARKLARFYPRLGFDPDYLMYRSRVFPHLESRGMDREKIAGFCRSSFLSALANAPLGYAAKVWDQGTYFLWPDRQTFFRKRLEMQKLYTYSLSTLPEAIDDRIDPAVRQLYDVHRLGVAREAERPVRLDYPRPLMQMMEAAQVAALPIVCAFSAALLACGIFPALAEWRMAGLTALLFYSAPAGNALTVALVHALDNSRYRAAYGTVLAFALLAMLVVVAAVLAYGLSMAYRNHRRAETNHRP